MDDKDNLVEDESLSKRLTEAVHAGDASRIESIMKEVKDLEGQVFLEPLVLNK
jgi:hypothetical protein